MVGLLMNRQACNALHRGGALQLALATLRRAAASSLAPAAPLVDMAQPFGAVGHRSTAISSSKEAPPPAVIPVPWRPGIKRAGAVGLKLGMMSIYDEWGKRIPVTVIHLDNCQAIRSFANHNATIMEVGAGKKSFKQLHTAQQKLYTALNKSTTISAKKSIAGFPVSPEATLAPGTPIYAAHFVPGQFVDLQSKS